MNLLPIANCQLPIEEMQGSKIGNRQSAIGNRQLAIGKSANRQLAIGNWR
jgi:hypothetical protein